MWLGAVVLGAGGLLVGLGASSPRFFPDDPLWVDDDRAMDASQVQPTRVVGLEDLMVNTVREKGDRRDVAAMNINTADEVPDSSWFTSRIGRPGMTMEAIARGPDRFETLSIQGLPIVEGKGVGLQPGFRVRDAQGHLYQVKLDGKSTPEMSTAAEMIGTTFFHAIGYNVAEAYLVEFDPAASVIAPDARIEDGGGRERPLVRKDIEDALASAARLPNGRYRALASRFIDGKPLGGFRFWGTRPDDPNDVFPHEHRRELRALRVFAAWLNHDEADSTNTFDALVEAGGRAWVKHYLLDFGSLLGSDTMRPQRGRSGNEYLLDWGPGLKTAATLGLYVRPWLRVDYPDDLPQVGRFEADFFDPVAWRPVYANPAFDNLRPEDAFWAARIVARFDEAAVRAVVAKARYSDPRVTEYMVRTLLKRREKVLEAWLNAVNPVVEPRLAADGVLTFGNAAVDAGVATPVERYRLAWFRLDNATGAKTPIGDERVIEGRRAEAPDLAAAGPFVGVTLTGEVPDRPEWKRPVTFVFRRTAEGWQTVGVDR